MAANHRIYEALIVGSGFSGISMAISLKKRGIHSFLILEKANDIGGTWRDNTYPGAQCDVPSALYSYSFEPFPGWKKKWSDQPQILEYLKLNVEKNGLQDHILYEKEFLSSSFIEKEGYWEVISKEGDTYAARSLIMAIGQLHHPKIPNFKGTNSFKGDTWHSAKWNHDIDLKGKRVGVIGNAASAIQFIPKIVPQVESLTVFQRSAKWLLPKKNSFYNDKNRRLHQKYPFILNWSRHSNNTFNGVFYHLMGQNKLWKKFWQGVSMSHLKKSVKDPELLKKLTPDYPMGAVRVLLSDEYYPALAKENVNVNIEGISHFTEDGIVTLSGSKIPLDIIIYATGFESNPFLKGLNIHGLNGISISNAWEHSTETYLGISTTGFPNFFMMFGPNTNLAHSSVLLMVESQAHYITECLTHISRNKLKYMNVKPDFQKNFTHQVNERMKKKAWTLVKDSWYKDGDVILNNWPGKAKEYQKMTKTIDESAYTFCP
ncbi:flavin-containing monooxygenase [Chryseobacterium aurantiacum]|uniref:flavin-containing monooxygenase n=1 Tax=Chryseobacterium aurantiacum TaxID=2116499 RepID=UPI000D131EA4|nr:NAD(P)/FAD-dependent oxidoreductase [Chryseobacterium aurantiacum]